MRKLLPLIVVGILVFSGLGAVAFNQGEKKNIVSKTIVFSQPKIVENEKFISIDISDANSNYWETGKPLLPVVSKVFEFEFGTMIDSVEVTFSNSITQKLSKLIEPAPELLPISSISELNIKSLDGVSYEGIGIYPKEKFSYKVSAGKSGENNVVFCAVSFNPIQYNPTENIISYAQSADINIKYTPPANPIILPDEYDLLILTPDEFESTLQRFVNHKEGRNIRTKLVTLDEIPSYGGVDEKEDIKFFIKEAIETWGIDYLILVGSGVEGKEKFPVRLAWIGDQYESNFPSDLYYADIYNATGGFSDWDYDEDGKFAEYPRDKPDMDLVPDVYLGKIPCNNVGELDAYIDKVIWYDEHNLMTKKIVQIGGDTFPTDPDNINEGEYANSVVLSKLPGYTSTKLWASNGELTKPNIADGYKKILPDFFDFSGHGSSESWATHLPQDENQWIPAKTLIAPWEGWYILDFDQYSISNPKKYPIVFYNACSNNKFTKSENCLSWRTLKMPNAGGIIAFGASGIGIGSYGTSETERVFGWMEVHTHDELYSTKILGEVWGNCVTNYFNTFESTLNKEDYKTLVEYSMFGDPTLKAEDGDDPRTRSHTDPYFNIFEGLLDRFPRLIKLFELLFTFIN